MRGGGSTNPVAQLTWLSPNSNISYGPRSCTARAVASRANVIVSQNLCFLLAENRTKLRLNQLSLDFHWCCMLTWQKLRLKSQLYHPSLYNSRFQGFRRMSFSGLNTLTALYTILHIFKPWTRQYCDCFFLPLVNVGCCFINKKDFIVS